jgi:hypothetical protein
MTHTVFFWLNPRLTPDQVATFESEATKLLSIDVVQGGFVGKPAATPVRPVTDKSFTYALQLEFASVDDHNTYQDHPDHHAFVHACKVFWDKVVVYDTEAVAPADA